MTTDLSYMLSSLNSDVCNVNVTVSAVNGNGVGQPASTSFFYNRGICFVSFYQSNLQVCHA